MTAAGQIRKHTLQFWLTLQHSQRFFVPKESLLKWKPQVTGACGFYLCVLPPIAPSGVATLASDNTHYRKQPNGHWSKDGRMSAFGGKADMAQRSADAR